MSAKILAFDPNRRVPPRHYTPIAMRGRILQMPARLTEATPTTTASEGLCWVPTASAQGSRRQG
jgi:hypothetical protein